MQDVNETAALLKRAGVLDHRRPDEAALLLWHELLAPYTLRDCVDALTAHRRESSDYLMPAHIIDRVRAVRRRRALAVPAEANPEVEDDYPAACRVLAAAVQDGEMTRADYDAYAAGSTPAREFVARLRSRSVTGGSRAPRQVEGGR